MKIEIKSVIGEVLFEYDCENNTIRKTLEEAVKRDADLRGADLGDADLRDANLGDANLGDWGKLQSVSDILTIGAIGSRDDYTTIFHTDKGILIQCGCFNGTLEEFETKVKQTHQGNKHEKDYMAMIEFAKAKFEIK